MRSAASALLGVILAWAATLARGEFSSPSAGNPTTYCATPGTNYIGDEQNMLKIILASEKYESMVRPKQAQKDVYNVLNSNGDVVEERVQVELHISTFFGINEKDMHIRAKGYMVLSYTDCRLSFKYSTDPSVGNTYSYLIISQDDIDMMLRDKVRIGTPWTPYLHIGNLIQRKYEFEPQEYFWTIRYDGLVLFHYPYSVEVSCNMDFEKMPFDNHDCDLEMFSHRYDSQEVVFSGSVLPHDITSSAWEIGPLQAEDTIAEYARAYGIHKRSQVNYRININRKSDYIIQTVMVPSIMFWFISYMGFYVNSAAVPARVAVHLLPILITGNLMKEVHSMLPPIAYETWLSQYLDIVLWLVCAHLVAYCTINFCEGEVKRAATERSGGMHGTAEVTGCIKHINNCSAPMRPTYLKICKYVANYGDRVCWVGFGFIMLIVTLVKFALPTPIG